MILSIVLLGIMLVIMLMRVVLPIGTKIEGRRLKETGLSFRERLLLQRTNIYAIGFVLLLTVMSGGLSYMWELLTVLAVFAILFIPVRYVITTEGVGMNNVVFRSWSEFSSVDVSRRRIRLEPKSGVRPFELLLLGDHQKQAVGTIRKFIGGNCHGRKEELVMKARKHAS